MAGSFFNLLFRIHFENKFKILLLCCIKINDFTFLNVICFYLQVRGVSGKKRYITCRSIGKSFMLIMATLQSNLILYL